jgi:hypothetical protein
MTESHQPFLFRNDLEEDCILFCRNTKDNEFLLFGENRYGFVDWNIFFKNLNTNIEYRLNIPKYLPADTVMKDSYIHGFDSNILFNKENYLENKAEIVICCNPHFYVRNGKINLFFIAGIVLNGNSEIQYFICSMESVDFTFTELSKIKLWKYAFSGTVLENGDILYVQRQKFIYFLDKLIIQKNNSNQKFEVDLSSLNIQRIFRVSNVYNSNYLIITCRLNSDGLRHSFLMRNDFLSAIEIFSSEGKDIYKCSLSDNKLAYAEKYTEGEQEKTRIIFEDYSIDNAIKNSEPIKLGGLKDFKSMTENDSSSARNFPGIKSFLMPVSNNHQQETITQSSEVSLTEQDQEPQKLKNIQPPIEKANQQSSSYPGMFTMAKSFGTSMVRWAKSGFQTVDEQSIFNARLEVCKACPEWDSNALGGTGRCKMCGCSTQAKLRLATESCPKNLWGPVTEI